jgi:tRNA A37 threonylcarbamoyladenosine dehydratase
MLNESDWQSRTRLLIGADGVNKLHNAHVLVVGLGGVGLLRPKYLFGQE